MRGQTEGQTQDPVIGSALHTMRAVSVIEQKPVNTISTILYCAPAVASVTCVTSHHFTLAYPYVTHRHTSLDSPSPFECDVIYGRPLGQNWA